MAGDARIEDRVRELDRELEGARARVTAAEEALRAAKVDLALAQSDVDSLVASRSRLLDVMDQLALDDAVAQPPAALDNIARADRTDAIVAVLTEARGDLGVKDVVARLHDAGRDDPYQVVATTLRYLTERQRVANPQRGRYRAV